MMPPVSDEEANLEKDLIAQSKTIAALSTEIARFNEQKDENKKLKKDIQQSAKKAKTMQNDVKLNIKTISDDLKAAQDAHKKIQKMLEAERVSFANLRGDLEQENVETRTRNGGLQAELDEKSTQLQTMMARNNPLRTLLDSKIENEIKAARSKKIALAKFVAVKKELVALKEKMLLGQCGI